MKEELIKFDTAILAHDLGFNHVKANCFGDNMAYQLPEGDLVWANNANIKSGYILAPTQSLLQRWLREERGVHIEPFFASAKDFYCVDIRVNIEKQPTLTEFKTYEEALEAGLVEGLKIVKSRLNNE